MIDTNYYMSVTSIMMSDSDSESESKGESQTESMPVPMASESVYKRSSTGKKCVMTKERKERADKGVQGVRKERSDKGQKRKRPDSVTPTLDGRGHQPLPASQRSMASSTCQTFAS